MISWGSFQYEVSTLGLEILLLWYIRTSMRFLLICLSSWTFYFFIIICQAYVPLLGKNENKRKDIACRVAKMTTLKYLSGHCHFQLCHLQGHNYFNFVVTTQNISLHSYLTIHFRTPWYDRNNSSFDLTFESDFLL